MTQDLRELAQWVMDFDGPSRDMDSDIALASGWATDWHGRPYRKHPYLGGSFIDDNAEGCLHECPAYTYSLDAAKALLPDDCDWLKCLDERGHTMFAIYGPDGRELGRCVCSGDDARDFCAAALLARASE